MKQKGERVRNYFVTETNILLERYENIAKLIPNKNRKGAAHVAEEGRFIESLLRDFLNKHLPKEIRAVTGFIYRPATKIGNHDRSRRRKEEDKHSNQLDIIVFDSNKYPVFENFEEFAIVPPEGVIAIISVKKNLYPNQIKGELTSLAKAAAICTHKNFKGEIVRGPNTCLISFSEKLSQKLFKTKVEKVFELINEVHKSHTFDQCISQVICLDKFSVFKKRPVLQPKFNRKSQYIAFNHSKKDEFHFGIQFLLTGILSVYYDPTRNDIVRPGFTSFPLYKKHDLVLGEISNSKLR